MLFIFHDVSQSKAQDFARKKICLAFLLCLLSFRDLVGFSKSALPQFLSDLPGTASSSVYVYVEHNANKMQFSAAKIRF